ncbi:MAG: hypothetical protein K9N34_03370 [Candidatus Marinimicrobia bacterium]|nr:hypothetical protein [Candidatus Neomarinimicrobiota bacterium]MCF7839608.1 hypothetical protein [Candidatus Neomarinimicrobiota bacterium]
MRSPHFLIYLMLIYLPILLLGESALPAAGSQIEFRNSGVINWTESDLNARATVEDERVHIDGWDSFGVRDGYLVPIQTRFIHVNPAKTNVRLSLGALSGFEPEAVPHIQEERMLDGNAVTKDRTLRADAPSDAWYAIKTISRKSGEAVLAVTLYGAKFDENSGKWLIPDQLTLTIETGLITLRAPRDQEQGSFGSYLINASTTRHPQTQTLTPAAGLGAGKLKLSVSQDGIYRVRYSDFRDSLDIPGSIASQSLTLRQRGTRQPIFVEDHGDGVFGDGDYLEFVGKMNRLDEPTRYYDPFSDVNVYWLDWNVSDGGLRLVEESGYPGAPNPVRPTSFRTTVHLEKDSIFDRLGSLGTNEPSFNRDHFFWATLNSGGAEEIPFILPYPHRGSAERVNIRVGLTGLTYSGGGDENGEHRVYAFINDQNIGSGNWHNQTEYVIESSDNTNLTGQLFNGSTFQNQLQLIAPSTAPGRYDRVVLNWLDIEYDRLFTAFDNQLYFEKTANIPPGLVEFEVKNLTSPDITIIKEGTSLIRDFTVRPWEPNGEVTYSAIFQDQVSDATPGYWIAAGDGILTPERILPDTMANIRNASADYIIITNRKFMSPLEPLVEHKMTEGLNPIVVSIQDIYDEFNYGIAHPEAIRDFLRYGLEHWSRKPKYVLLVGDANINPKLAKNDLESNYIPTFFIQTQGWGAAEADYYFSLLLNDDYVPDVHVGRIPCTTFEEVERVVEKIINYETQTTTELWSNEILAIAGFEDTFKFQSENLVRHYFPRDLNFERLYIDRDSEGQMYFGNTDTLVNSWNEGKLLINFMGHGGGAVWADRSLFTREDVERLTNIEQLPFVSSMTCFTGGFAQTRGLGEVALKESDAGAIGWWGSSGVGWVINDYLLVQTLFKDLLDNDVTLGEAIDITRMRYYGAPNGYDYLKPSMLFQYNFLGDPALRLKRPTGDGLVTATKSIMMPAETPKFRIQEDFQGKWHYQIVGPGNALVTQGTQLLDLEAGDSLGIELSGEPAPGSYRLIYTAIPGTLGDGLRGFVEFTINQDWFDAPVLNQPIPADSAYAFPVSFFGENSPDSVRLVIWGDVTMAFWLESAGSTRWQLSTPLSIAPEWQTIYYRYEAYETDTLIANSATHTLPLVEHENIALEHVEWGFEKNQTGFKITINYSGQAEWSDASITIADLSGAQKNVMSETITVRPGRQNYFFPAIRPPKMHLVDVVMKTDSPEDGADNQLFMKFTPHVFQILPGKGLTLNGRTADTLKFRNYRLFAAEESDSGVIAFSAKTTGSAGTSAVSLFSDSGYIHIESLSGEVLVDSPKQLFIQSALPIWELVLPQSGSTNIYPVKKSGILAMGAATDVSPPRVEMMIGGQRFFDGNYVSHNAELNLVCEDEAGFSWDSTAVEVWVDDIPQSVQLGDTTSSGEILSVLSTLDLSPGDHVLKYRVADALLNWSDMTEFHVRVASGAEIMDYGNYPNPFQSQTWFVYELTQDFEDLSIDIFTLAGHKIHSINIYNALEDIPLNQIGYHEILWHGVDRFGDFVANGVYFYRISGHIDGKSIEGPVGKIVKVR